jgi:FkbH-like protein
MKKCLVLDLDNTLWGGIVGEDGADGIALSLQPPGNSFVAFQQAILDYYDRGVILAINSRNNPEDAWGVIRAHPNMILKEHHFAAHRINWQDKAENLRELAQELNIGLDSMVFLDDDPTNRALVRAVLPQVEVPELPQDPREYTRFLHSLNYFDAAVITDEDKMRGNLYVTERLRREEEKRHTTKEEFLHSLGLTLHVYVDEDSCVARLAQLTEKTNQFNTLKRPASEEDVRRYIADPHYRVYYGRLEDQFGDYGVVVYALVRTGAQEWLVESLLMSCRVFGRGVEHAFVGVIAAHAKSAGAHLLRVEVEETAKNTPAREFVAEYFVGATRELTEESKIPAWIQLHENI